MPVRSVSLGLVLALVLSACGGAAAPSILVPVAPTDSTAPTVTSTTDPNAGTPAITIVDNAFQNGDLTVTVGTTVTWTNHGQRNHTVSTADASFGSDGTLGSGASYAHAFDTAGTFAYFCAIHSAMRGTITVTQ